MIRVLIAEDMDLIRGALVELLRPEPDIEVVADVARGDQIVPSARESKPDIAVIDIRLPEMDGIAAAQALHEELPRCRVVMLTALEEPGNVRRAAQACASGFLRKTASPERLADTIRRVADDQPAFDTSLMLAALDTRECPLTTRELEVLRIAGEGAPVSEIAARLFLSVGTVRNYLSTIITKLCARNRVDAIRIAGEAGWL